MTRKKEFTCSICGTLVKRTTLTERTLDSVQCEKDTNWRRRLLKVYNKTQDDFHSLKEYNDYLEQVEGMDILSIECVWNLHEKLNKAPNISNNIINRYDLQYCP